MRFTVFSSWRSKPGIRYEVSSRNHLKRPRLLLSSTRKSQQVPYPDVRSWLEIVEIAFVKIAWSYLRTIYDRLVMMGKTHSYRKKAGFSSEYEWFVKISPDCRFPCWLDGSVRTQASRRPDQLVHYITVWLCVFCLNCLVSTSCTNLSLRLPIWWMNSCFQVVVTRTTELHLRY